MTTTTAITTAIDALSEADCRNLEHLARRRFDEAPPLYRWLSVTMHAALCGQPIDGPAVHHWGVGVLRQGLHEASVQLRLYGGDRQFHRVRAFWTAIADAVLEERGQP